MDRVLIVDFDVHHGNGTQSIFYNNDNVFFLSFHQKAGSIYPFSGFEDENNAHTRNINFDLFIDDAAYLKLFEFAKVVKALTETLRKLGPLNWQANWEENGGRAEALESIVKEHEEAMEVAS